MAQNHNGKGLNPFVKAVILCFVLASVAGIYVYKKSDETNKSSQKITQDATETSNAAKSTNDLSESTNDSLESTNDSLESTNNVIESEDARLPLAISSVDLDAITSYGLPFVIDFGSDSCQPCKAMAPVLETLHEEWQGKAIVHFVDVWVHTSAANDFPVSVIPTQVFYNADGTPFVPSDELATEIGFTVYRRKDTNEHVFTVHQGGVTEEQMRKIFAEMGVV